MAGYNGSTTIHFTVERVVDSEGKYLPVQEGDDPERIQELELEIYGKSYFAPGKLSGPPEDCYPDEGDTEIHSIMFDGKPWSGELTDSEVDDAETRLQEAVCTDEPDYPDPEDREYDETYYDDEVECEPNDDF